MNNRGAPLLDAPGSQRPGKGLRVAMFGVMTFMLIAVISVIVVTLFAVVFLSRKSQEVVMRRNYPNTQLVRLPIAVPPRNHILFRKPVAGYRPGPIMRHQKGGRKRKKARGLARLHNRFAGNVFFKSQKKRPKHRKGAKRAAKPAAVD
ncbi:unnamed protein product [Ixodes persulcatus]